MGSLAFLPHFFLTVAAILTANFGGTVRIEQEYDNYQEFTVVEGQHGLFPTIFNLATNGLIYADATCGQHHREIYCKLVEHVFNRQPQCDVCDANDVRKRHPIEFAIDGTRRWWQSPSLANGLDYERVNITIDLRQEYQVAYVIVKSAIAPRPGTWVLEKSLDGVNYQPWQYYAVSDAECMRQFNVPATTGVPRFTRDDEVICTSYYSKLDPLENGEIYTSLVNGRPSAEAASETLQQFTRARYVRLRLMSLRTLNADLMIINRRDKSNRLDLSVTRRYFYAIKDISIGGQCICHGHAESCPPDPVTGQSRCECRHNTCGESCSECCPLFNQLPWRQGTQSRPNVCQPCQCFNHATRCEYDEEVERLGLSVTPEGIFEGGGRCIACEHNTDGINCERCKWTYFRPAGVTHYREDACQLCDCDPIGSEHNNCVRDETSADGDQKPGDCICKPGFGGRRCDVCAPGYRNHPKCEPCPCNRAGSLNFDTCEEEHCICKTNVEGLYCDRCKKGTINLDIKNPEGCQPCFCFGLSKECHEKQWNRGEIRSTTGWVLTDLLGEKAVTPKSENEILMYTNNEYRNNDLYYWKAPKEFNGNLLNSYGGILQYYVYFVPMDNGQKTSIPDVIIEGNGVKVEYYSQQNFFPRENISIQIPMKEGSGWHNSHMRTVIDKHEMMRVLADVNTLMIRAVYNREQIQSSIYGLTLDTATGPKNTIEDEEEMLKSLEASNALMRGVEVCQCPEYYAGNSCERCISGYRRVNNQLFNGRCEKCNCEGHSFECDPFTGDCISCQHNTTGRRCHQCLPGHYGNPSLGGELGQCRPCACPTIENSHSTQCSLTQLIVGSAAAYGEDAYVCTACEHGYDGNKCEICADGFFGNPLAENGTCEVCDCNDNIDPMTIGNCDRETGKCLKCIYNTAGDHCEECKENHWGNPKDKSCRPCGCHPKGSHSATCNRSTGICDCHDNYVGIQCNRCKDGHGDIENMCPPCNCNMTGSFSSECDEVFGQCACKTGVFGKQCDMCRASYFNFTENGCQFCHCNSFGAVDDGRCDNVTGKCECRENVEGKMCEKCVDGYFNITSGHGCQECACDPLGSEGIQCDTHTGQCVCKSGVTGLKCDKCAPNHFGLDSNGCKECRVCPAPGHICDSVTGECICPPNTVGEMCENCSKNAWNYDPLNGCILCDCSSIGADGPNCNPKNGQCNCRMGFVGLKCDRCMHGHFNFPKCELCNCDLSGTDPTTCENDSCLCDEKGQCSCKKNVVGLKCDSCDAYSFSLEESNTFGCTDCFCFNRTNFCVQSSLVWQQIYASDRQVIFSEPWKYYTRKHNLNVLREDPPIYNSYPTDITPLYWPLPSSFLGDRTSSYNGFIRFTIKNDDNYRGVSNVAPDPQHFRFFPQVIMVGNHRIILEHTPDEMDESGRYKIRLHESQWRSRLSPDVRVTRKQLMIALQNLQGIYIRATYNYPSTGDAASINEISIDVAVWDNTTDPSTNSIAIGVEQCECPQGYDGNSCQDPAEGYCRKRQPDFLNSPDDLALVGGPQPCACNGHSTTCEAETCRCTNCEHNTYGDYCELCKPGYQGNALIGGAACTKCACPLPDNSFSDTCLAVGHGRGYVCDACKPGYTGLYCENCLSGYYGNPNIETGQCECRPGLSGRDCSLCKDRHAFINGICTSCDQGCTRDLMKEMDDLEELMKQQNFINLRPVPWKRVARINNATKNLRLILESVHLGSAIDENTSKTDLGMDDSFLDEVNGLVEQTKFLLERTNKSKNTLQKSIGKAEKLSDRAREQDGILRVVIGQLRNYINYGFERQDSSKISIWIQEANNYVNAMKERGIYIEKRYNRGNTDFEKSQDLMKLITSRMLNHTSFVELRKQLDVFGQWLHDYRDTIWDRARQDTVSADKIAIIVAKRVDRFNAVKANITALLAKATNELSEAENEVSIAKTEKILAMFDDFRLINETLLPEVDEMTRKCRDEADKYGQLLDEYREEYVEKSERHAAELENEAQKLQNSFADTKNAAADPLRASNAYKEIVEALRNASKAAEGAKKAAEFAYIDADPKSEISMVNMALQAKNRSMAIKRQADELSLRDLENERVTATDRVIELKKTLQDSLKRKLAISEQYQSFDDQHDRMAGLISVAGDAEKRAKSVHQKMQEISIEIDTMSDAVSKLQGFAGEGIRNVTNDVRKANQGAQEAMRKVSEVKKQTDSDSKRISVLGEQIKLLQEKIKEAREKASRIRISMKSDENGNCRRSFISPAHLAPTNLFTIKYRPLRNVPDSLLFLTKTKTKRTQQSEYIAMELRDRRIVVQWNIGSGTRMATNTHTINYIAPGDRTAWYHIVLERFGNSVTLTVALHHTISGEGERTIGEPTTVSVGQPDEDDSIIFNTVHGETLIQFGIDAKLSQDLGLATNKFLGTIGEFTVDGETLPLWAFAESTKVCEGHFAAPESQSTGYFFRDGFAQIHLPSTERPSGAQITVILSAYSPDGLLYFRGNQESGDFISLELRDGHVLFRINLGGDSYAIVKSKKSSYTDGRLHTVRVIRNYEKIHLQVDDESDRNSVTIPGENARLNINGDDHFVGGIPPGFSTTPFSNFDIQWNGFFGCIQSVRPSQVAELDLDNPIRSQRKLRGCTFKNGERLEPTDRVVGFNRPGYLLIQGLQISNNSTYVVSSNSHLHSARKLLMLHCCSNQANWETFRKRRKIRNAFGNGYLAFYLYRGYLVVHLGTDSSQKSKVLTLRSEVTYNDGQLHSIFFTRFETLVRLRVDDREIASGTLGEQNTIGTASSQLFIGGFPNGIKPSANEMPMAESMIGCVSNIFVDYRLVPIIPEAHIALIGSCPVEQIFSLQKSERRADVEALQADEQNAFNRKASKLSLHLTEPTLITKTERLYADGSTKTNPVNIREANNESEESESNDFESVLITTIASKISDIPTTVILAELTEKKDDDDDDDDDGSATEFTALTDFGPKKCGANVLAQNDGEGAARFGIAEASHSKLNFEEDHLDVNQFKIEFAFRTVLPNGMLWVWANYNNYTRYFFLNIIDGLVQLQVRGSKEPKILVYKSNKLNDGKWHNISMLKQGKGMLLKVDRNPAQHLKDTPNPKVIRKRMYVGGVISRHRKRFHLTVPSFSGCIRNFVVNGMQYDLFEKSRHVVPCIVPSNSAYVHESGYMTFGSLKSIRQHGNIQISVQFRPAVKDGFIFGLMANKDPENARIAVYLKNSMMTFDFVFNNERRDLKHIFKKDLCDGAWHNVTLSISHSNAISITVDGHRKRLSSKTSPESVEFFRSLPIYVGGVTATSASKIGLLSLIGCYQDLQLHGKPVAFKYAKKLHKVLPDGCPFLN
uniref:Laminin subunit alpha-2 n=1 Tax=Elaeophora elaphi TaxID=1147741 RepID=A0A0R3RFI4_9BILA